jgi:hypothetical protein
MNLSIDPFHSGSLGTKEFYKSKLIDSKILILNLLMVRKSLVSSLSSLDSDLEAFSHYPTDDSFASLVVQPKANTIDPN